MKCLMLRLVIDPLLRYAEIIGAPEPPTRARVGGWRVRFPLDTPPPPPSGASETAAASSLTEFASSDARLDAVWALSRDTIVGSALDQNTDSNTRQVRSAPRTHAGSLTCHSPRATRRTLSPA